MPRPASLRTAMLGLALAISAGCASLEEYTVADACDDIATSVANKALECTDDPDVAVRAHDAFTAAYHCGAATTVDSAVACQSQILGGQCDADAYASGDPERFLGITLGSGTACDIFDVDTGAAGPCSLIMNGIARKAQTGCTATPPAPFTSLQAWAESSYSCRPDATVEAARACRDALTCGLTIDELDSSLLQEACKAVLDPVANVDGCAYVATEVRSRLRDECGNGTDAFADALATWASQRFSCDPGKSVADLRPCLGLPCPSVSDNLAPNLADAELALERDLYALGCASALSSHECGWRYAIDRWIFRCTGDDAFALATSQAFEAKWGCANAPSVDGLVNCWPLLPCLSASDSATTWIQTFEQAAPQTGCPLVPKGAP